MRALIQMGMGVGDHEDPDDDNDGVGDLLDAFPFDPTESLDTDGDGVGNHADTDDDKCITETRRRSFLNPDEALIQMGWR